MRFFIVLYVQEVTISNEPIHLVLYLKCKKHLKIINLNNSKNTLRMVGYHLYSPEKTNKIIEMDGI